MGQRQLNVRVPEDLALRMSRVAKVRGQSLNEWVVQVLAAGTARDYERYHIEELGRELEKLARTYLPGRVAGVDEMLALAETFAVEDAVDGVPTRPIRKRGTKGLTPDGTRVVSASNDTTLKVWDLATGRELATFQADGALGALALSPGGRHAVAGDTGGHVYLLELVGF